MTASGALTRDALELAQHAVDPQTHEETIRLRQEMNVARTLLDRLEDQRVDELDERARGLVLRGLDILFVREPLVLGDEMTPGRLELALEVAELELDVLTRSDAEDDLAPRGDPQFVDRLHVGWIGDRYEQALAVKGIGHGVGPDKRARLDRVGCIANDTETAQVDVREVETLGDLASDRHTGCAAANAGRGHPPRMSWTRAASSCGLNGFAM